MNEHKWREAQDKKLGLAPGTTPGRNASPKPYKRQDHDRMLWSSWHLGTAVMGHCTKCPTERQVVPQLVGTAISVRGLCADCCGVDVTTPHTPD